MQPIRKPDDARDTNGNPAGLKRLRDNFRKRFGNVMFRLSGNEEQVTVGDVDQSQSHNDLVPWFVGLSIVLAVVALVAGAALALAIRGEQTRTRDMELMGRVVKAETEAKLAPQIAKLQTDMARAMQDAAQAKDWTDSKNTELKTLRGAK